MRGMAQGLNLAKSTNDNSFGMFRTYLSYKLTEQGKQLIIDKWHPSSKLCNYCGHKNSELSLSDRIWTCQECGKVSTSLNTPWADYLKRSGSIMFRVRRRRRFYVREQLTIYHREAQQEEMLHYP